MKPGLKPRIPKPADKPSRDSVSPHDADRNRGGCSLYELKDPFSITLVSVSNANVDDFSLVIVVSLVLLQSIHCTA